MIKTVVFDLDNTLMMWKDEYIEALSTVIKNLNLGYENRVKDIDNALVNYENEFNIYTKEKFVDYINRKCNINLPLKFVDDLIIAQSNCYSKLSQEEIETLEYLNSKYELIVISNWFTKTQKERLKNANIYKYFKVITGGDEHELKPSFNAFKVLKNPKECIMIGDNLKKDIYPALELGMQAVLIGNKYVRKSLKYKKIKSLIELREIL